jgi:hypothetical protein
MSALAEARPKLQEIAADIDTALAHTDWRRRVSWPVGLAEASRIGSAQMRAALSWAQEEREDDLLRDAGLLALPVILGYARAIVLAALATERAARAGARIDAAAPEFAYLRGGQGRPPARHEAILSPVAVRSPLLRRIARMGTWTAPARLPRALMRPQAVAVSHNSLLCATAMNEGRAVGFRHAETILGTARRRTGASPPAVGHAMALAQVLAGDSVLDESYRSRALDLIATTAQVHLDKALADMAALRNVRLPDEIWSGSGGLYAPRAVGLEVLRRGGRVTRFDHGTPREFVETAELTTLLELSVSSEFVLATAQAAAICRERIDSSRLDLPRPVAIRGGNGDPIYAGGPRQRPPKPAGARLRVVYAPTQLLGFRQLVPALPPDVIYLDWQMRVAEALRVLDVDFICQAHPEGLLKDRPHPLAEVAMTLRGNFEAQLHAADVFVFDCPTTTTLWQAACTDARIVFLDIGAGTLAPPVAKLVAARATVIPVAHDEDNRMLLDGDRLRAAVLEDRAVDPSAFRRLLAGES